MLGQLHNGSRVDESMVSELDQRARVSSRFESPPCTVGARKIEFNFGSTRLAHISSPHIEGGDGDCTEEVVGRELNKGKGIASYLFIYTNNNKQQEE